MQHLHTGGHRDGRPFWTRDLPSQTDHRGSQVILLPAAMPVRHHQSFSAATGRGWNASETGKCTFRMPEGDYLEHKICQEGLQPTESKVSAVADAPEPKRVAELRSFLGLVIYYGKFLANLATTAAPLYNLLKRMLAGRWARLKRQLSRW